MANILISMYNFARDPKDYNVMPPFYEGFVQGLLGAGNNIFCFFHKDYNYDFSGDIPEILLQDLRGFSPDVAIFFNNNFWDITKYFDIPVVVYDVDSPLHTKNIDDIKKNKDRYNFITIQKKNVKIFNELFNVSSDKTTYIEPFTEIHSDPKVHPTINISFVGANWMWGGASFAKDLNKVLAPSEHHIALENLYRFTQNPVEYVENTYSTTKNRLINDAKESSNRISGLRRARVLTEIADLGLELRGLYWDQNCMNYFPEIALCYNREPLFSLKDNQDLYNSSKISICTHHIQAISGFSWRVCDIMASNACLVTEYKSDIATCFPGVNIPTFTSPAEARERCIYLLENENARRDIVAQCNEIIDRDYRFQNVLERLESFLGMNLHSAEEGSITYYTDVMLASQRFGKQNGMFALSSFEAKHRKFSYKLNKAKIRLRSLFYFNKKERKAFREESRAFLEIRYSYGEQMMFCNDQQKKIAEIVLSLKEKCKQEKLNVAFFVIYDSVFPAEPVFKKMLSSKIFEPKIIVIPDTLRGRENMISNLYKTYDSLYAKYGDRVILSYVKEADNFIDFAKVIDIVCSANPYDSMTHDYYRIRTLLEKNIISFYTNYGYPTVYYARKVFETQFCSLLWKYFIETEEHIPEYENSQIIKGKNTVVMGYPKMDALADCNLEKGKTRKRIILAPHHTVKSVGGLQLSNFLDYAEFFLELPKLYPDINFIFRPHPMLFTTLARDDMWGNDRVEEYINQINNTPNMICQNGGDYFDTFMNSDGIIHDCSSFMAEWLYTEKMGCYLLRNKEEIEEQFVPFGVKLVNLYEHAFNKDDIINYIENVIAGRDERRDERIQTVRECLKVNYPHSSDKIVEYLESQFI